PQQIGDIAGERGLSADVMAGEMAVDPYAGLMVDRAQMQQRATAGLGGGGEGAAVPDHRVEAGVVDPGGLGLGHERHRDGALEGALVVGGVPALGTALVRVVVGEAPRTVQRGPVLSHEGGAGVGAVVSAGAHHSRWLLIRTGRRTGPLYARHPGTLIEAPGAEGVLRGLGRSPRTDPRPYNRGGRQMDQVER